jgi:hypothetical protein
MVSKIQSHCGELGLRLSTTSYSAHDICAPHNDLIDCVGRALMKALGTCDNLPVCRTIWRFVRTGAAAGGKCEGRLQTSRCLQAFAHHRTLEPLRRRSPSCRTTRQLP